MALSHDRRVLLLSLAGGLPALVIAVIVLAAGDYSARAQWTLALLMVAAWLGCAVALRERVVYPLQTLSNLLAALREDDFSIRARPMPPDDPLGDVMTEVNALSATLRRQRLGAVEASALLRAVIAEIDVAIFAFDGQQRLRLVNRSGERLLGRPADALVGHTAAEIGLAAPLDESAPRIQDITFPGGSGRWEVRRTTFRESGLPHELLVLADVSQPLREQERQAWQRLIRVIGHELNNSLAPIKSIAGSLEALLAREPLPADWRDDMQRGVAVIGSRADALSRFTAAYARLARLPAPRREPVALRPLVERVAGLETRVPVQLGRGPDVTVTADGTQIEQLLINLLHNAADASLETGGRVTIGWRTSPEGVELWVDDEGPGVPHSANLFVPFFTTKPGGSGIGLVLCRQIAEGHGGTVRLENRPGTRGARATLRLPNRP